MTSRHKYKSKYRRFEKKIRKYLSEFSKIKFRNKLRELVFRIGIYSSKDFQLGEFNEKRKVVFPCHLGILFCDGEQELDPTLFKNITDKLNLIFDSLFFSIHNLGGYNFSGYMLKKGTKIAKRKQENHEVKVNLQPTNKFYHVLINKRNENNLNMIAALTSLPLYSSTDNNIIFLFGEAHLKHACCVISTLKLKEGFYNRKENQHLMELRILKEIIHEVGHLILGHEHCSDNSCVMWYSKNVEEIDNKSIYLCNNCLKKLNQIKLKFNI